MVCDGAMVLNFVASAMMNGVCCMHSMEQDERRKKEQHEVWRKVMSVEYQRQRLMEHEQQERFLHEQGLDAASLLADERRRRYIAAKLCASQNSGSRRSCSQQSEASNNRPYDHATVEEIDDSSQRTMPTLTSPRYNLDDKSSRQTNQFGPNTRSRSVPTSEAKENRRGRIPLLVGAASSNASVNSSLLDNEESDSDDGFDVIQLK
jgi:hypothetical protein